MAKTVLFDANIVYALFVSPGAETAAKRLQIAIDKKSRMEREQHAHQKPELIRCHSPTFKPQSQNNDKKTQTPKIAPQIAKILSADIGLKVCALFGFAPPALAALGGAAGKTLGPLDANANGQNGRDERERRGAISTEVAREVADYGR